MVRNVLWTGGWDSTFRVLDLVFNKKESLQPYYILDNRRNSTFMEIKTMEHIKRIIEKEDPEARKRILDTITIEMTEIPGNESITKKYNHLASQSHLGDQHDWLARYTDYMNIDGLEISVHVDDNAANFLKDDVELMEGTYKLKKNPSDPGLKLFARYHFPLLNMTKLDMEKAAKKSGFQHIMEQTWFCHNPKKDGTACGLCNPCNYTREEGLGRRVPTPNAIDKSKFILLTTYRRGIGKFKKVMGGS
ncbi:7-cyano-7-deazaguanine synthase [Virgibacillus byunsanensis]|uniref:7-cyano-7-deazaguanine synthase n=1 Tax=Virgibacillus byunsanensis TaxID=570945 RepID=A0ABW3LHP6_9BACI